MTIENRVARNVIAPQSGSPMTCMVDGKQYIVVAVGGGPYSGEYLAFGLPSDILEETTSGGGQD